MDEMSVQTEGSEPAMPALQEVLDRDPAARDVVDAHGAANAPLEDAVLQVVEVVGEKRSNN